MEAYPSELLLIAFVAMLAPLLAELPSGFRLPVVVLEVILGILIGPHVFHLTSPDGMIGTLGELGLTFLLFMVGLEIDFDKIRGRPLSLAAGGWFLSFFVALVCMFFFNVIGLIQTPPLLAAVALSTTALGVLAPILRDRGELNTDFGTYMVAAAAAGEFGPLVVISMLLIPTHSTFVHALFMVTFIIIAFVAANIALNTRSSRLIDILTRTMQSSGQLPVRICILLQILFVALAAKFGLNIVMGAFAAGIVVKLAIKGEEGELLRHKLDAIGYGFLIPIFFIVAGMKFEVSALWSAPLAPITGSAFVRFDAFGSRRSVVLIQEGTDTRRTAAFRILFCDRSTSDYYHQRNRCFLRTYAAGQSFYTGERGYDFGPVISYLGRKITRKIQSALVILTKKLH